METTCQFIKGYFVLRPCGREAETQCTVCGKAICKRCRAADGSEMCKDCYSQRDNPVTDKYDDDWLYRRRRQRYHDKEDSNVTVFHNEDRDAFEPGNQTDGDSTDWGDESDISAFDS